MQVRATSLSGSQGSTIALALITCAILTILGVTSFMVIQNRSRLAHQTARWQEALLPAEAGIDLAVNEVRKKLYMADLSKDFFSATIDLDGDGIPDGGWQHGEPFTDANGNGKYDAGESFQDLNGNGTRESGYTRTIALKSDADHQISFTVEAEEIAPATMGLPSDTEPYWRVRSSGTVSIPSAAAKAAGDKLDVRLRKLDLFADHRTQKAVDNPKATRVVEAILKPLGVFRLAVFGIKSVDLKDRNIVIDSYDSRDPNKSTYDPTRPLVAGQYDSKERQQNGDVATNGKVIQAGNAHIYGDVATNGGTDGDNGVIKAENVTGDITNGFYQTVFPVQTPKTSNGTAEVPADAGTPTVVTGTATIQASDTSIANVRLSSIKLSSTTDTLTIKGKTDAAGNPIPTYAQIVVSGNIDISGNNAGIIVEPGVFVRIFVSGDATIAGKGIVNASPNTPLNLQLYGVDRYKTDNKGNILKDSDGNPVVDYGTIKIAGNGGFMGAVYAPHYNIEVVGGGTSTSDSVYGSLIGNTVTMTGVTNVHYDEALGRGGIIGEYKVVSWMEDVR